jgi:hypothetical protein
MRARNLMIDSVAVRLQVFLVHSVVRLGTISFIIIGSNVDSADALLQKPRSVHASRSTRLTKGALNALHRPTVAPLPLH